MRSTQFITDGSLTVQVDVYVDPTGEDVPTAEIEAAECSVNGVLFTLPDDVLSFVLADAAWCDKIEAKAIEQAM